MALEEVFLVTSPLYRTSNSTASFRNGYTDPSFFESQSSDLYNNFKAPDSPDSSARRSNRRRTKSSKMARDDHDDDDLVSDDDDGHSNKKGGKPRRELPAGAVATLKAWLLSPEHFTHPYPTPQDQIMLMQKTGIDKKQLKNWFTNARRRIWKPMLKKQLESGKVPNISNGGVAAIGKGAIGRDYSQQVVDQGYGQPQQVPVSQGYDSYGNPSGYGGAGQQQYSAPSGGYGYNQQDYSGGAISSMGSASHMNKTDSHAVLMELFARDQDLVRQAARDRSSNAGAVQDEGYGNGNQHPMNKVVGGTSTMNKLGSTHSMNSWPHFSSVSSLNNLGTMTGVRSIANMSSADLASQGSLNKKGNLAQVKSIESMGRNDSYAFLEVFFDNPVTSISSSQRGIKREREDDDNVGLSLDGDDTASPLVVPNPNISNHYVSSSAPVPAPLPPDGQDNEDLKRAYDDALAARGLISVSRSSEKLTDLALPAKLQKSISQQYLKTLNNGGSTTFTSFSFNPGVSQASPSSSPGPDIRKQEVPKTLDSVEVPIDTKCAFCNKTSVDTQLRPCGHLYHSACIKNSLAERKFCPLDQVPISSAVVCFPVEEN
jgi:hypothetical protein